MNIDELTIGQIRELSALFRSDAKAERGIEKKRVVLVVDRGWIFAGDQSLTSDGMVRLDRAVHVFGWQSIGFARVVREWKSDKVDLRPCDTIEVPSDAIVFRVPVSDDWGLK